MTCPACSAPVPEHARFCPECGQRLVVAPDERRLVTVVMADLVGFTALAADTDPEQVKRLVDASFERLVADVTAFGGTLDKIVGDEIVALFGVPTAHEDDAERAVRAALRMHDTLQVLGPELAVPVQLRVGVNTGEVLVGAMRAGGDATVMGDVVNTAQRLEKLAAPGEVVVGPATYAATRDVIQYEALGPQELRGRDTPVNAYRALAAAAPPGRRRARDRVPLVGRDAELDALAHVIGMAVQRRRAQLVLLVGDAGVGKSRIASELAERASHLHRAQTLHGQCVPYGDSNAFGPIAEALRHACDFESPGADSSGRTRVVAAVTRVMGLEAEAPETERIVEGLLYFMDGVARPGVDPGRARDDALRSTFAFMESLASHAPLVLTVSDVHWATPEVLDFCERMLARLHNLPLVLVATARATADELWAPAPGRHNALVVHLEPLDDAATADLVRALYCEEVDTETVSFLLERSGGNPFFVEELVAYLQETRDGGLREIPATLHGLVAARLDTLAPAERSMLEDCAVVGSSGSIAAVSEISPGRAAVDLLERLADRDLLVLDHDDFHFKSELIRDIAYGTLTKAERARRHAALAPVLAERGDATVDQVAHHLATAAELVAEIGTVNGVARDVRTQAVAALERAAERDHAVESWLQAERHHDRALALVESAADPAWRRSLLGRGRARVQQHLVDAGRSDALAALDAARADGDRYSEAVALTILGDSESAARAHDAAEETYGEALRMWRELHDDGGAANVLRGLGMTHMFRGELIEAERFVSEALASFRAIGDRRGEAWALQNLAWIAFERGDTREAETRIASSADVFGEVGDWGGLGWAYGLLSFVRYNQGRLDEAATIAASIRDEGRESGNRWAVAMMNVLLANISLWTGKSADCVEYGRQAVEQFRDIGDGWGEVMATGSVIRALAELGRDGEVEEALRRHYEVTSQVPDPGMKTIAFVVEAGIELQRGNADHAWELVERAVAPELANDRDGIVFAEPASAYGLARLQLGDVPGAISMLERAYHDATDDGPTLAVGCRLALAYACAHRTADALAVVEELGRRPGGTYSDRMFALWAESLARAQSHEGDARAPIDAAHAIAVGTDAPLEHAIAALARSRVLAALGDDDSDDAADDADRQLRALGLDGDGWKRVFDLGLDRSPALDAG